MSMMWALPAGRGGEGESRQEPPVAIPHGGESDTQDLPVRVHARGLGLDHRERGLCERERAAILQD